MNPSQDHTKHLVLLLTYGCNLHCTYCYENHKPGKTMSVDCAIDNIWKGFENATKDPWIERLEIIFMGGEPFLEWKNIRTIVETIEASNCPLPYHFFAATNGTLLSDEIKQWIAKRKEHFILGISIDGNIQMQNTNRSESASKIDLDYFARTWPKQAPKVTISHNTLPFLCEGIIYLHNKGFEKIQANLAMGQKWSDNDLRIYAQQLDSLSTYYLLNPNINRCSLLNLDITSCLNLSGERCKYCGCGEIMTCIDVDGTEYPCQMFAPITLTQEQIKKISTIDFREHTLFMNEDCTKCMFNLACPRCYGMSFKTKSDVKYQQPFLCKAFKIQFLSNCILWEKMIQQGLVKKESAQLHSNIIEFVKKYLFNH